MARPARPFYFVVFFASLAMLSFEVTLVRLFSMRFSYHYAALVISIAMAGLVLGGIYASLSKTSSSAVAKWGFGLALSYPAILFLSVLLPVDYYRLLWEARQAFFLVLFIVLLAAPFFVYGVVLATSFASFAERAHRIYAADLLGAGIGACLIMPLLDRVRPEYALLLVSAPLMLAALLAWRAAVGWIFGATAVVVVALVGYCGLLQSELSPFKGLMQALQDAGSHTVATRYSFDARLDLFENPRMKSAPGLSLAYTEPIPRGLGMALDGDIVGVLLDEKKVGSYEFFRFMPAAMPYLLAKPKNVLTVGGDSLVPHYFGARTVAKAEKNRAVERFLVDFYPSTSLYRQGLAHASGRSLAQSMGEPIDLVAITMGGFFPGGSFGLQEEYDMTVEALTVYLSHLSTAGYLFIQTYLVPPPRYELKIMNTLVHALAAVGITKPDAHCVVFRSWDTINFLAKKSPFTPDQHAAISRFLESREFDLVYPASTMGEAVHQERFITGRDYGNLLIPLADASQRDAFLKNYPFDVSVTTDDRPFFHYFLKTGRVGEVYELAGRKWVYFLYEGMALPFVLVVLVLFAAIALAGVMLFGKRRLSASGFCYFSAIGLAFMFVELFLVHQFIRPLITPVSAFTVVVATMLFSSAAGSFASGSVSIAKGWWWLAALPTVFALYLFSWSAIMASRLFIVAAIPLGFLMGFFFPLGIKKFCSRDERLIPLAYAVNGAASVVGPPAASTIAVLTGCSSLLVFAFLLYGGALLLLGFSHKGHESHTP
jgi:hypothetical protein